MKKLTTVLLGIATILMAACQKPQQEQEIPVAFVSLDKPSVTLEIGDTFSLTATVLPAEATDKTVLWSSSKAEIASVDDAGKVTAISEGTTIITAKAGTKYATCTVSVKRKTIPVESISLNKTQTTIEVGDSETLTATVLPENADNPNVTWSTSDEEIATVSAQGVVTAVAEGTAVITATAGNKIANCTVIVPHVWVPVESVTLNKTETTIEAGASETLTATVLPANADDPSLTWSSSDEAVAIVSAQGVVTAVSEGTAVITATAESKSASCTVTVPHVYVPVESVTLDKSETTIEVGKSEKLTATVLPANADKHDVSWASSDGSVATVSAEGVVTAVAEGTAVITATVEGKSASCTVTVPHVWVPVESVTLNKTETKIEVGNSETLTATVLPANADNPSLTWNSSNEAVATVKDGVVTAVAEGTAVIKATAEGKSASCTVTVPHVWVPVESVTLNKEETTIIVGNTEKLTATVLPANADNPSVSWTSSNESVATVSSDGLVTAIAEGTAVITATADGKSASCTVTVPHVAVPVESITLDKTDITVEVGETEKLNATVLPPEADDPSVTWTSSDESVATVSSDGLVTAIAEGSAVITAKAGSKTATCTVTVPHVYVPVESVTLDKSETTIEVGNTEKLTATVNPTDADYPDVSWVSSDESVATVSSDGVVTAVAEGTAVITATADGKSATCNVTVYMAKVDVSGVTLNETSIELTAGETFTLVSTVKPDNATDKSVTWTSSSTAVASVTDGLVRGLSAGTAVITVRTNNGGYEATCTVTVNAAKDTVGATTDDWIIEDELSDKDLM